MSHKILFTASTFSHIANFHRPYLAQFARLGWEVHVACGGPERDIPEAQRIIHIPLEKSMTSPKNWQAVRLLRRMVREEGYALVSCHTSLASFFTRLAVMGLRERASGGLHSHGYLFDGQSAPVKRALLSGAERMTAPVTDLLMTMNDWDGRYAQKHRLGRRTVQIPRHGGGLLPPGRLSAGGGSRPAAGPGCSARSGSSSSTPPSSPPPEEPGPPDPGPCPSCRRPRCWPCRRRGPAGGLYPPLGGAGPERPGHLPRPGVRHAPVVRRRRRSRLRQPQARGSPSTSWRPCTPGSPIAASAVKGHTDLIRPGETGLLFPYGDLDGLRRGDVRPAPGPDMVRPVGRPGP